MAGEKHLFNAAVVGENPDSAFVLENYSLHAVEKNVAKLRKEQSREELVIPVMRDALQALIKYSEGKVPPHFLRIDWNGMTGNPNEQKELIYSIVQIYIHLPHYERNHLSSLVHQRA